MLYQLSNWAGLSRWQIDDIFLIIPEKKKALTFCENIMLWVFMIQIWERYPLIQPLRVILLSPWGMKHSVLVPPCNFKAPHSVPTGYLSCNIKKCTFEHVHPVKIQISLCIRAVWSEFSMGAFWVVKDAVFLHVDNEDWSDCTYAHVRRSIFSLCGSLSGREILIG